MPQAQYSCGFQPDCWPEGMLDILDANHYPANYCRVTLHVFNTSERTMQPTYPENRTFNWEEKDRLPFHWAIDMCSHALKQRGTEPRRATYIAVLRALEAIDHVHEPQYISTKKLKSMLVAAAQEHGWYLKDPATLPKPKAPESVPPDMKWCCKCQEVKAIDGFVTTPTPAKARAYGWREDTTIKVVGPLCRECRKAKQQKDARKVARRSGKDKMDDLARRANPAQVKRHDTYARLVRELATHAARVRAAYSNVKVTFETPEGTYHEYQFRTDELRQFYESKKVLVAAAMDRLDAKLGETAPLPDTWGMLLTRDEQVELSNLHAAAVQSSPANRKPVLWTLTLKE
jgi:hypothetical protein